MLILGRKNSCVSSVFGLFGPCGPMLITAVTMIAMAAPASAAAPSTDLIVRFRAPQNSVTDAVKATLNITPVATDHVRLVNSEEGLVGLHFESPAEAAQAQAKLQATDDVLSVAPNFLYKPAISLQVKDAPTQNYEMFVLPFAPMVTGVPETNPLPAILPPPSSVSNGTDPLAAKDWALPAIHQPDYNTLTSILPGGSAPLVRTAVIDTGVDYNHEDLRGAMWREPVTGNVGYDFAHNVSQPYDVVKFDIQGCLKDFSCSTGMDTSKFLVNPGHGTHCAGHVGAVADNSLGIRGIGTRNHVMGLKFFYDAGDPNAGQGDDNAAIQAVDYAIKHGVKVISASWGGRIQRATAETSELKQALIRAQQAGVLVVIAAGNDGIDQDNIADPDYPAAYNLDNLIIVAASDAQDNLASFSNFGATSVHLAAPGVKILSTTAGSHYSDVVATFTDSQGNAKEMDWDGTSMATPIVAGAVSLVWARFPDENYHQIRDRILNNVRKVPALAGKMSTGGVLDVAAALGLE